MSLTFFRAGAVTAIGAAALALAACGAPTDSSTTSASAGGSGSGDPATATSAADLGGLSALEAAAKKEGALNVIALPPDWANYGEIINAFQAKYPEINDATADFVYLRLQGTQEDEPAGYPPAVLDQWLARARAWEAGGAPADLPTVAPPVPSGPRDCFVFMISGAKVRNPAAAMALIERID